MVILSENAQAVLDSGFLCHEALNVIPIRQLQTGVFVKDFVVWGAYAD